jgi:hypothetical protein
MALRNERVCLSLRSPIREAPVCRVAPRACGEGAEGRAAALARSRSDEIVSYQRIQE